jgi:hypothetical protein
LDPALLTWQGQSVLIEQDQLAPAVLTWQGQDLVVQTPRFRITKLATGAVPGRPYGTFLPRDKVSLGPATLTWQGQDLVVATALVLDPAVLTWTGQPLVVAAAFGDLKDLAPMAPLTGVH